MPNNRGMTRWIAALALALAACASETRYVEAPGQDDDAIRTAAHEGWAAVGVDAPADYTLLFLEAPELADACNADLPSDMADGAALGGCSFPGVVLLNIAADLDLQLLHLTHELGHLMRPGNKKELAPGHLDCPEIGNAERYGNDVMCLTAAEPGTLPTSRDAAFVSR